MSEVFEGYERQYCELSANLSRKCTSASALNGGISIFFICEFWSPYLVLFSGSIRNLS